MIAWLQVACAVVAALIVFTVVVGLIIRALDDGGPDTFGIGAALGTLMALAIVSVPLGLWKLVEIILWLWRHVHVGVR